MARALLCWQMLWAFLQLSGDHHCFLWALLCLVLWSVLLITVCLRQKLPKLSLSLNFEMSCSNDGILSLFCMNGIGYGKVPAKNHDTVVYLLCVSLLKQKGGRRGKENFLSVFLRSRAKDWLVGFLEGNIIRSSPYCLQGLCCYSLWTICHWLVHVVNFKPPSQKSFDECHLLWCGRCS